VKNINVVHSLSVPNSVLVGTLRVRPRNGGHCQASGEYSLLYLGSPQIYQGSINAMHING